MNNTASDFVKVDLRGLKVALVAHARRRRVSLSRVVRDSVELVIDQGAPAHVPVLTAGKATPRSVEPDLVKVWFRLTSDEVAKLKAMATRSGLSRSAVVGEMLRGTDRLVASDDRREHRSVLIASNAELAAVGRNLRHLADLLRQSQFEAAQKYRALLDTVADDIKKHLKIAGGLLADMSTNRLRGRAVAPATKRELTDD